MQTSRAKVAVSLAILLIGLVATILAASSASSTTDSCILVDFGDRDVTYVPVDSEEDPDSISALEYACALNGFELVLEGEKIVSINGIGNSADGSWGLYGVPHGDDDWVVIGSDPSDVLVDDYTVLCWGHCDEGEVPTRAVDATGVCFYGYNEPSRVVSLAPTCTEILCSVGGFDLIVGADMYSNYPSEVVTAMQTGEIKVIGGFTNPSYEMVLKQDPDLVVCMGNQNAHVQMSEKLRSNGVDVLVISGAEDIDVVLDNIYMVGTSIGENDVAVENIGLVSSQISEIGDIVDSGSDTHEVSTMISLSAVKSPWVSGSDTYISDIMDIVHSYNIYTKESGWVQVNAETILKYDPSVIVVASTDYTATQEEYDSMIDSMSSEWRGTTAYRNGDIYLLAGEACDLASRAGPRVAQMTELMARIIHGDIFGDGIVVPHFVGGEYRDYLTITKEGSI